MSLEVEKEFNGGQNTDSKLQTQNVDEDDDKAIETSTAVLEKHDKVTRQDFSISVAKGSNKIHIESILKKDEEKNSKEEEKTNLTHDPKSEDSKLKEHLRSLEDEVGGLGDRDERVGNFLHAPDSGSEECLANRAAQDLLSNLSEDAKEAEEDTRIFIDTLLKDFSPQEIDK